MENNKAYLIFWQTNFMYIGKGLNTKIHDHHAIQLIFNLDSSFELRPKNGKSITFKSVLIHSDLPHQCYSGNDTMIILNIAPESPAGALLKKKESDLRDYISLDDPLSVAFIGYMIRILKEKPDPLKIVALTENYLQQLSGATLPKILDPRIEKVLNLLARQDNQILKLKDLMDEVYLSESRLIHLFKQQMGIPIRKYMLWYRLVKAIQHAFQNNNLTQAALDAGFSDAPHFNKTLKRMFGLNFSSLKNSQNIQAWWI